MHGWLQRTFVSALAVGLAGVALGVPSSAETPPDAPSLKPRLSAIACTWLEQNPQLNHGLTCPKVEPQDQEREAVSGDVTAESADLPAAGKSKEPERSTKKVEFGANVDATNPDEDVASGQSETAIAVSGRYVVSVWNDATGFLIRDTSDRASLTGVGFSADGGKTFTDLGGLPNSNRCQKIFGDPAVVAHQGADGSTFFYVFSLYLPVFSPGCTNQGFKLSMNVGTVAPDGNTISFGQVIVVANGGFFGGPGSPLPFFLDKDFATIDHARGKIALSYTAFGFDFRDPNFFGQINIALCDISQTPGNPSCSPGDNGVRYLTIANNPSRIDIPARIFRFIELEGAYPALSDTGDLYVTWNRNFFTNRSNGDPFTHEDAAKVNAGCLTFPKTACSTPPKVTVGANVKSLDSVTIPGYNRGVGNDFPRIAFNATTEKVVIVWNEGNAHPMGDIVMVTTDRNLGNLSPRTRVNDDNSFALHFLPAVSVDAAGNTNISWYDRRNSGGSTRTDVFAVSIPPGSGGARNSKVTDAQTDWLATGSVIAPNFGDYTDNTSDGNRFFVNWSDGRIGIPNSFVASAKAEQE